MEKIYDRINQDYYDFVYEGVRYYRAFYNFAFIDKDCICGHVKADIGTRFIVIDYNYRNGSKGKIIVPDDDNLKSLDKNGNPANSICLVDSETFFQYFIPGKYQKTILGKDGNTYIDDWKYRIGSINYIYDHIFEQVEIKNPHGGIVYRALYKKDILNKLDDIAHNDSRIDHIINRGNTFDDNYDIFINRHNLYFLNRNEDYDYIKDVVLKVYKEVKDNYVR